MKPLKYLLIICLSWPALVLAAGGSHGPIEESPHNVRDWLSLQRGAKYYANYCQGCHALSLMRYKRLAEDTRMTDRQGRILEDAIKNGLAFNTDKISDKMLTSMKVSDGKNWFGKAAPDLSLITRRRGADWVFTYLKSFYVDDGSTWGVNNAVYENVGMPHVLAELQGEQSPVYKKVTHTIDGHEHTTEVLDHLELTKPGTLSAVEYDKVIADITNFLVYVGEPIQLERQRVGVWVILFLLFFAGLAYILKREYWKDVH